MRPLSLHERCPASEGVSFRQLFAGSAVIGGRSEFTLTDYAAEIVAGGFPAMRHLSGRPAAGPSAAIPRDGTLLGGLFESLAALSVRTFAQNCDARVSHLRTKGGRLEVDFVVEADAGVVAFEVKLSAAINDPHVSHLHWLRGELGDNCIDAVVLNTGPEAYRRRDGIAVIPLALLLP